MINTEKQAHLKSGSNLKVLGKITSVFACEVYLFDFFTDKIFENQLLPFYYDGSKKNYYQIVKIYYLVVSAYFTAVVVKFSIRFTTGSKIYSLSETDLRA